MNARFPLVASLALALFASAVFAQSPYLVKDLDTGTAAMSSSPGSFGLLGNGFMFAATTAPLGRELWKSDGTAAGTVLVKDVYPGDSSSSPEYLATIGGTAFFMATTPDDGRELWKTDGTAAGTVLVKDFVPGWQGIDRLHYPVVFNGKLYFRGWSSATGYEPWVSDGTAAGTHVLKDTVAGYIDGSASHLTVFGNRLYFANQQGLWSSDGTGAGTTLLRAQPVPRMIVAASGKLYLVGYDTTNGSEYWVSDGTAAGTTLLRDIRPGSVSAVDTILGFAPIAGGAMFVADDGVHGMQLWKTDGTTANTQMVTDTTPSTFRTYPPFLWSLGSRVLFRRGTAQTDALWVTDGSAAGTIELASFPQSTNGVQVLPIGDGRAFFSTLQRVNTVLTQTLWITNGTPAGTTSLATLLPTSEGAPSWQIINGALWMAARDASGVGSELWTSDGTSAGTRMVANLAADAAASSGATPRIALGANVYATASVGGLGKVFRSDGTADGTVATTLTYHPEIAYGGYLFEIRQGTQLWRTDGTAEGAVQIFDASTAVPGSSLHSSMSGLSVRAGRIYFTATTNDGQRAVWSSDGTSAGTARLVNLSYGESPYLDELLDRVYVRTSTHQLWRTDGTVGGTTRVLSFAAMSMAAVPGAGEMFGIQYRNNEYTVARHDGSAYPATNVKTLPGRIPVHDLSIGVGRLYFFVVSTNEQRELWRSDGTDAGTFLLKTLGPAEQVRLTPFGERLLFTFTDATVGSELWITDGEVAGTFLLRDIAAGTASSNVVEITVKGEHAWFAATEVGGAGRELWRTDGTTAGTIMAGDIHAGSPSSSPNALVSAGNRLFFNAFTTTYGGELWAIELPAPRRTLSIGDVRVSESSSTARVPVILATASDAPVSVVWTTVARTATAGADFVAASGTLTFAPGETAKEIAIALLGDSSGERNELLHVVLSAPSGAPLAKSSGVVLIEDDDLATDLELTEELIVPGPRNAITRRYTVRNLGPGIALGVALRARVSPADSEYASFCHGCSSRVDLQPGESFVLTPPLPFPLFPSTAQHLVTAYVSGGTSDPNQANNSVSSLTAVFDAQSLTGPTHVVAGSTGVVTMHGFSVAVATATLQSSNPQVLSVPSSVATESEMLARATVNGVAPGVAKITANRGGWITELSIPVIHAGGAPSYPSGVRLTSNKSSVSLGQESVTFTATVPAWTPHEGLPTGTVRFFQHDQAIGEATLTGQTASLTTNVRLDRELRFTAEYVGDHRFFPSVSEALRIAKTRADTTYRLTSRRVNGGVLATVVIRGTSNIRPTGTVGFWTASGRQSVSVTPGIDPSEGIATLTVPGSSQSLYLEYSGDETYAPRNPSLWLEPMTARDFDRDGRADLLWRNGGGVNWMSLLNGTSITGSALVNQVADPNWQIAALADFDGDGDADVLWRHAQTGGGWMYLMSANRIAASVAVYLEQNLDWQIAGVADFDGDGRADILWRHRTTGTIWMYRMHGATILASVGVGSVPDLQWRVAGVADFNADGRSDILWRHAASGQLYLYEMNGNAIIRSAYVTTVDDPNWRLESLGDFNGDGKADLLWRNAATGSNWIFGMSAEAIAHSAHLDTVPTVWHIAATGDYNGDGTTDILWRHGTEGQGWMYLMNGHAIAFSGPIATERNLQWQIVK